MVKIVYMLVLPYAISIMIIVRLLLEEIGPSCCLFLASGYPGNLGISKLDALIMMIV